MNCLNLNLMCSWPTAPCTCMGLNLLIKVYINAEHIVRARVMGSLIIDTFFQVQSLVFQPHGQILWTTSTIALRKVYFPNPLQQLFYLEGLWKIMHIFPLFTQPWKEGLINRIRNHHPWLLWERCTPSSLPKSTFRRAFVRSYTSYSII